MNQALSSDSQQQMTNSLALRLKTETAAEHERMHQLMGKADIFATLAKYTQFTLSQYYFQLEVEHLFEQDQVSKLIPDLDIRGRSEQARLDLQDLQLNPQGQELVSKNVQFPAALGWIYVSEGSTLGAAFLFKEAQKQLGLSAEHGARNLAAYPEGRAKVWKRFVQALDEAQLSTEDAQDLLFDGRQVGAFLKYSRFSNNDQNTYTGAVYGKSSNGLVDGLLYFTQRDSDNVKRPDGTKFLYSAQTQDTYLAKLNFYPSEGHKISLNALQSGHKGWEPFAAMRDQDAVPSASDIAKYGYDEAWRRKLVYRDQSDESYSVSYEFNPADNPYINLKAVGSYSKTNQHDDRLPSVTGTVGTLANESWVKYMNTAFKISNISDIQSNYGNHKIKVGAQFQRMQQSSWLFERSKSDRTKPSNAEYNYGYYQPYYMPEGTQDMLSAFIEDQYQIGAVTITPSLRYDNIINKGVENAAPRYNIAAAGHDYSDKSYTGWSPRLALAWQQTDYLTWFGNISKTWRSPRLDELYSVQYADATASGTSRYLKPEKMLAIRLGNEMNFQDLFHEDDHLQLRLTYHHNRGSDEIFKNLSSFCQIQGEIRGNGGDAGVGVCNGNYDKGWYRNIKDYTVKAYEAELFYNQPMWFSGITYAYIRGERDQSPVNPWIGRKTWMSSIPPKKATATLGVNVPEHDLTMGWRGIFVGAQRRSLKDGDDSIAASSYSLPKTKGYSLHSVFVDWQPMGIKGPTLNLSIDNLFNREYRTYLGEYMTGTGRDYKFSISQRF